MMVSMRHLNGRLMRTFVEQLLSEHIVAAVVGYVLHRRKSSG